MADVSYQELEAGSKEDASVLYDTTIKLAKQGLGWTGRALEPMGELTSGSPRDRTIKFLEKIIDGNQAQGAAAIPKDELKEILRTCCLAKLHMEGMRSYKDPKAFLAPQESLGMVDKAKFNRALVAEVVNRRNPNADYLQEVTLDIELKDSFPGIPELEMRQVLKNMGAQRKEGNANDPARELVLKTSLENAVRSIAYTSSAS